MLSTSLNSQVIQEEQIPYKLAASFSTIIDELNNLIFKPICGQNYDITSQIPFWVIYEKTERESQGISGISIFDFIQKYYDWLYCDDTVGAQYSLSKSFLDIIDVDKTQSAFLERMAKIYAPGFNIKSLENNGGIVGEENLRNFIKNIRTFFYHRKTTEDGIRYFFKTLYNVRDEDVSIEIPKKYILRLNGGRFESTGGSTPDTQSSYQFDFVGLTGAYESIGTLSGSYLNGSRLQDGGWIQEWSYLLKVGIPSNNYKESYVDMAHPAGLRVVFEKTLQDYEGPEFDDSIPFVCELPMLKNYSAYILNKNYSNANKGITYTPTWIGQGITFIGLPSTNGCTSGFTGFTGPAYLFPNWTTQTQTYDIFGINISTMIEMCYPAELGSPNEQIPRC